MVKIVFIMPYEGIREQVDRLVAEVNVPDVTIVSVINSGSAAENVNEEDADIFIARGVTYTLVKERFASSPVIDIPIDSYDIMRALFRCRSVHIRAKILLLVSTQTLCDIETLRRFSNMDVHLDRFFDMADAERKVKEAVEHGFDHVVGGLTVCKICQQQDVSYTHITSGETGIRDAINKALHTAMAMNAERAKSELIKTILQSTSEAIAAVNEEGHITVYNEKIFDVLPLPPGTALTGRHIDELIPNSGWEHTFHSGQEGEPSIFPMNREMLYSRMPIMLDERCVGVLFTFESIDRIQNTEKKLRNEFRQKGHVAKYTFESILHKSPSMKRCVEKARRYAVVDSSLLILGETGTGKEILSHSVHGVSKRSKQPFVTINCAALPEQLLESELFGYVEGAFSGASRKGKIGLFELAHKGTIFLDEIGEMPLVLQAKLLRVLQEYEIRRLGDNRIVPVDVRVIAATNMDLKQKITAKQFREDLYYRLNTLNLTLPPLRQRTEDIELLTRHFIGLFSSRSSFDSIKITDGALNAMLSYPWPGNVRELQNLCQRAAILSESGVITKEEIEELIDAPAEYRDDIAVDIAPDLLNYKRPTREEIAQKMGISRTTLWRRSKKPPSP